MATKYGYARVSTRKQIIERQIRNIKNYCETAVIIQEAYTGTKLDRPEWSKLYKILKKGDWIIFDSVSRMSRNAEEGFALYRELYDKGIELVFLNERHIDTESYREALEGIITGEISTGDNATDELVNTIMSAVNKFMFKKVEADIKKVFEQAQKEVDDLHKRTSEGMLTAKLNGKRIGTEKGRTLDTKKSKQAKPMIKKYSKEFDGTLSDRECMKLIGIANNTYYKYKRELMNEIMGISEEEQSILPRIEIHYQEDNISCAYWQSDRGYFYRQYENEDKPKRVSYEDYRYAYESFYNI